MDLHLLDILHDLWVQDLVVHHWDRLELPMILTLIPELHLLLMVDRMVLRMVLMDLQESHLTPSMLVLIISCNQYLFHTMRSLLLVFLGMPSR
jgi:hypothetical protein